MGTPVPVSKLAACGGSNGNESQDAEPTTETGAVETDDVVDVELELQGFGTAPDGSRVQIDVYVQELAGMPFDDLSWAGPEGVYGSPDDADVTVSGNQVTGTATLQHVMGDGTTLLVEFDLPVPSSTFACR